MPCHVVLDLSNSVTVFNGHATHINQVQTTVQQIVSL